MPSDIMDHQNALVVRLANSIDTDWLRIVISYEIEDQAEMVVQDTMLLYIRQKSVGFEKVSLRDIPREVTEDLFNLSKMMASSSGKSWSSCELVIDANGRYKMTFSYEMPKRINDVYDEQSYGRYNSYLDIYRAEIEAAAAAEDGKPR